MRVEISKESYGIALIVDGEELLCLQKRPSGIYRYYYLTISGIRKIYEQIKEEG